MQDFFRRPVPKPTVLICTTERCYRHAEGKGGVAKALSWSTRLLLVSPRGLGATIISHELTHIEFRNILGITSYAQVPSWFDEGLAVYVSNDLRYLKPPGTKDRCLVSGHDALPDTNPMWWQTLNQGNGARAYALAACRVASWAEAHGGDGALLSAIDQLKNGQPFNSVFDAR